LLIAALVISLVYVTLVDWLERLSPEEMASLQAKYQKGVRKNVLGGVTHVTVGFVMVLSIIAVSLLFGGIYLGNQVYWGVKSHFWLAEKPLCLIEPSWFVIHLTVGFLTFIGLLVAGMAACYFAQRNSFEEYLEFTALACGRRVVRWFCWTFIPVIVLLCTALLFACDNYAVALPSQIVINPFWGLGSTHYAYQDVVGIEQTSTTHKTEQGNQQQVPVWGIKFSDGHAWSTQSNIALEVNPIQLQSHESFVRIVSERSGRAVVKVAGQ
jgi:hypothetical protein